MTKIFIGNLSFDTTSKDLLAMAREYSVAARADVVIDRMSGRSKGFGFVSLPSRAARRFIADNGGRDVDGRLITVNEARPMEPRPRHHGWEKAASTEKIARIDTPREICEISDRVEESLISYFSQHPNEMLTMAPRLFEELVAECWDKFGYEVELQKRTRDGGIDVIAVRRTEVELRFLIQCKRLGVGRKVSVEPVRELLGVKADFGGSKAIIATTVDFTRDAKTLLERHRWELEGRDFKGVLDWLRRAAAVK